MLKCDYSHEIHSLKYESKDNNNDVFFVDIVEIDHKMYEVWLYHRGYGFKDLMFGVYCKDVTYHDLLDMVECSIEEHIRFYIEEYFD